MKQMSVGQQLLEDMYDISHWKWCLLIVVLHGPQLRICSFLEQNLLLRLWYIPYWCMTARAHVKPIGRAIGFHADAEERQTTGGGEGGCGGSTGRSGRCTASADISATSPGRRSGGSCMQRGQGLVHRQFAFPATHVLMRTIRSTSWLSMPTERAYIPTWCYQILTLRALP